jgi:hypothetical protein
VRAEEKRELAPLPACYLLWGSRFESSPGLASFRMAARNVLTFGTGISTGVAGLPSLSLPFG